MLEGDIPYCTVPVYVRYSHKVTNDSRLTPNIIVRVESTRISSRLKTRRDATSDFGNTGGCLFSTPTKALVNIDRLNPKTVGISMAVR